jgi:hypothetical protein
LQRTAFAKLRLAHEEAEIVTDLMLQDIPSDLYNWLEQRAQANHRSLQQEALVLLRTLQKSTPKQPTKPTVEEIMAIARQFAELPELDQCEANEGLGYDEYGLPH